jgi:hypothetical protein
MLLVLEREQLGGLVAPPKDMSEGVCSVRLFRDGTYPPGLRHADQFLLYSKYLAFDFYISSLST